MLASGAGAAAQNRMGTAVFSGMLVATVVGVFLIPGLFAMVERMKFGKKPKRVAVPTGVGTPAAPVPVSAAPPGGH
jgi:hydrophobic/amphiphilic exporter-1 (mainly G- bacteria), HAE1 family